MATDDDSKLIAENLYKRNVEISGKNKTLSLLSKLYEISLLTLAPRDLAFSISQTIQGTLSFELVGVWLYDGKNHQLVPLGFADSERLQKVQTEFDFAFSSINLPLDRSKVLTELIAQKKPLAVNDLQNIWGTALPAAMLEKIKAEGHVRASVAYPLTVEERVVGVLVLSFNRTFEDLTPSEKESVTSLVNVITVALDKALLYQQLDQANKQLQLLDKARAEFISIASHQLRTPPATIKWYVGAIMDGDFGVLAPDLRSALERVEVTNNSQISLIDDLLNASRIERGKLEFFFEPGDLAEMAKLTVEQLVPQAGMKKLKLVYEPPAQPIPKVMLDKEKVRQVINNFIDNAIKYTKEGQITVHLKQTATDVVLGVTDTGRGVAPEVAPTLFEKYTRGKDSATAASGLGLGLYVAKVVIEQNHGKIWVESPGEGKGSTFAFSLPINSDLEATSSVDLTQTQEGHK